MVRNPGSELLGAVLLGLSIVAGACGPANIRTSVPAEFRPACGRPGAHVTLRALRRPVTVPRAVCELVGVKIFYPGHGAVTVPSTSGRIANRFGLTLIIASSTGDVTVTTSEVPGTA